ncbi:MAG: hypothetical protein A2W93_06495 [Bacteroidetes bacterium GWF2_43_63]|nr:MAG: hypothetical protein A2W94_08040 [Bacteroidetes bacterium GWE2_42_42]OFY53269.1 MAG: hypothetical protein A2W93_06495 [Bacteroidetes bacterium GWF2_43_63]HBG71738.1 hypothetical protein [Bacteroidales bacterium]HCB61597.1 hypothetical protein [Bacteroidales bacterium]HCY22809.1 hypothetical protein [Bacteroidales bacterium]
MKQIFLVLLLTSFGYLLLAQENEKKALEELDAWSKEFYDALDIYNEIKDSKEESTQLCDKAREAYRLLQSSIQHCDAARKLQPDFSKDIDMYLADTYLTIAWFNLSKHKCVQDIFTDELLNTYVNKALAIRPTQNTILLSDMILDFYKAEDLKNSYSNLVYLGFYNGGKQKNNDYRRKYGLEYISLMKEELGNDFVRIISNDSAKKYHFIRVNNILMNSEEYLKDQELLESKVLMMELYAAWLANKKLSMPDAEFSNTDVKRLEAADVILKDLKDDGSSSFVDQQLMRLYNANMLMNEKKIAHNYLTEAKLHDHSVIEELYDYIEKTKAWRDETSVTEDRSTAKDRIRKACNLIFEKMSEYSTSADYEKLLAYYQYIDDSNGVTTTEQKIAEKKEQEAKELRREKLRNNWGLCVGVAPGKLIWQSKYNQLSLHADLVTAGFSHGFRYCTYDMYTDKSRFGAYGVDDGEPGDNNTYSGWEGSWWINLNSVNGNEIINVGPFIEFRYGNYEFLPVTTSVVDRETNAFTTETIDPIGKRFDVTYGMKATAWLLHRIYFQTVFGLGLGYRWLETGFDSEKYYLENVNFGDERWPKVTVPFRVGVRVGIKLF